MVFSSSVPCGRVLLDQSSRTASVFKRIGQIQRGQRITRRTRPSAPAMSRSFARTSIIGVNAQARTAFAQCLQGVPGIAATIDDGIDPSGNPGRHRRIFRQHGFDHALKDSRTDSRSGIRRTQQGNRSFSGDGRRYGASHVLDVMNNDDRTRIGWTRASGH